MSVEVNAGETLKLSKPRPLFEGKYEYGYDVSPDGKRFLMIRRSEPEMPVATLEIITDWPDELLRSRR